MTYQEYLSNPFSTEIKETDFPRLQAYAKVGIDFMISKLVADWVKTDICKADIDNAIVQQIGFINSVGINELLSGRIVKSESLDGYSRSYDYLQIDNVFVSLMAKQTLEVAFRAKGLMYRGV